MAVQLPVKRNKLAEALALSNLKSGLSPLVYSSALLALMGVPVTAQTVVGATESSGADAVAVEELVVTGLRATMTRSMDVKKENTAIVDAIAASDFGGLPGLSMSDVIENITSVSGHRGKGSASEMSIRGLGPFLGSGTFNGRVVTSAGYTRAVNYKKFPSDLSDKVVVYKSQQADLVEGGVAGTVNINSLRPLDFGRRKITVDVSAIYNEVSANQEGENGLGNEQTISYVDQFETDNFGKFGVTVGFQRTDSANPEETITMSSGTMVACASRKADGTPVTSGTNARCETSSATGVTRDNYDRFDPDSIYVRSGSYTWRNQGDGDYREGLVGAIQWQPNERWDINADIVTSDNSYYEDRHDFVLTDTRRDLRDQVVSKDHSLWYSTGVSKVETQGYYRFEQETYLGWGLNAAFEATDNLTLEGDISYSRSHRDRSSFQSRLGNDAYINYSISNMDSFVPQLEFLDASRRSADDEGYVASQVFNAADPASWSMVNNSNRTVAKYRRQLEERFDTIAAARFDAEYKFDAGVISKVKAGVRYSEQELYSDQDTDSMWDPVTGKVVQREYSVTGAATVDRVVENCFVGWNNSDFLSTVGGSGFPGGQFAQLDGRCGFGIMSGYNSDGTFADFGKLDDRRSVGDDVINEDVFAAYMMASFEGNLGVDVTGNLGVRVVNTKVTSTGYSREYDLDTREENGEIFYSLIAVTGGDVTEFTNEHSVTTVLPSSNITFYLQDDLLLRGALYRAMSRPNLQDMGSGRLLVEGSDNITDPNDLISRASGDNPFLEPLLSDNADLSLEWYPSKDSSISLAYYYKNFKANFRQLLIPTTVTIEGVDIETELLTGTYTDDSARLTGWELAGQHSFTWLPAPFDGFGVKLAYNYADSDFENEDPVFGAQYDETGAKTAEAYPFVEPANLFGFSKEVFSGSVFWENEDWEVRALYKSRSRYFQPNEDPASNRYVEPFEYVDVSVSYNILDNLKVSLQGINVLEEPQYFTRGVDDLNAGISASGTKYYLKLKATF
ncbi:MAG: TonB-dependent receptor [Pseudomonadota bacterium]|nr:TonB-dependent receptor [Pseudomonadota bacterium]